MTKIKTFKNGHASIEKMMIDAEVCEAKAKLAKIKPNTNTNKE